MSTSAKKSENLPLSELPVGLKAQIVQIKGDRALSRRLLSLGLRVGTVISVLQHRGKGVVVANAGTRIALGGSIASQLILQPTENHT